MSSITLTDEQRAQIARDMDTQIEMLSSDEVEMLATKLNEKIDIPYIDDKAEQLILVKIVKKIDRLLYRKLPNEIYGLVKNSRDGISDEDARQLKSVLATRINKEFDIPYIPEWIEQEILEVSIGLIVNGMRKNYSMMELPA
ncbi:MAG: hypothetical protein L3J89_05725 [Gammaproteobacteria bacterium]|nr:hypothetical protein [Gammaproteobacteria bacterium]